MPELSLEDRLGIGELVNEYAWLLDHRRWEDVASLCTADAELMIRGRAIVGHAGLHEWAAHRAANKGRKTQHQMTLLRLEPGQNGVVRGTAALVLHVAKSGGSGTYIELVGEYRDEYVHTPESWRFRRRVLVQLDDI